MLFLMIVVLNFELKLRIVHRSRLNNELHGHGGRRICNLNVGAGDA